MRILILGAGGHAQVVADILLRMQDAGDDIAVEGYLDDDSALRGQSFQDLPVLGGLGKLSSTPHDAIIIAIGDNTKRKQIYSKCRKEGEHFFTACHPSAVISPNVKIGRGSVICAGVVVNPFSVIGDNVILNTGCTVDHHNDIGDHTHIAPGVHLGGDVSVGKGTLIGIGATVLPQQQVGDWSIVGAGALVISTIPSGMIAIGIPAKVLKKED